jgi:signal transduction histidine kinase
VRWIYDRAFLVYAPEGKPYRVAGIAEDITAHRELEGGLRQAHKMESIGRLAGGIAHDFSNLLTTSFGGFTQMLLEGTHVEDPRRERLERVPGAGAADRASILTRQLLAFSRRQVLRPQAGQRESFAVQHAGSAAPAHGSTSPSKRRSMLN